MLGIKHISILLLVALGLQVSAQCPTVNIYGTHVSCFAGSNGTVGTSVTGGTGLYSYTWNTGANGTNLAGLKAGIYYVNVTDLNSGCTVFNLFTVNEPEALSVSFEPTAVKCFGASTGQVDLTVVGGTIPYTYSWSNSANIQDLTNVAAGTYTVKVTDAKGCNLTDQTTVQQTASAVNATIVATPVSCPLGADGAMDITPFGGVAPYTYNWNSGAYLTQDIANLSSGTYNVIITDALNCTVSKGAVVYEPTPITTSIVGTNISCYQGSNGTINLSAAGGTPPYSYSWSSTQYTLGSTEDLTGLAADSYQVTVYDAKMCTATNSITLTEPTQLTSSSVIKDVSCNGYADGEIKLTVSGGSAPYSFSWRNATNTYASNSQNITGLKAGFYEVTVTDFKGCVLVNQVQVTEPSLPLEVVLSSGNVKCYGDNSGWIDATTTGGTTPYTFNWSNSIITEDQPNVFAGTYQLTALDKNGCVSNAQAVITQPLAPLSNSVITKPATCFGFEDGSVDLSVSGGTAPYTYAWTNSQFVLSATVQDLTNFPAETYRVQITDAQGCVKLDSTTIQQPTKIQATLMGTPIKCYGEATGAIDFSPSGGVTPYGFQWSNNAVTEDLTNLTAGLYAVTLTDANGCIYKDSVVLTQPTSPLSGSYFVKGTTCFAGADGFIFYTVQGGTVPYQYNWSNGDSLPNVYNLTAGTYVLQLIDNNGCSLLDSIQVSEPMQVNIQASVTSVKCFGQSNGSIDVTIIGGTPPYNYEWMNSTYVLSAISEDLINFPSDNYYLTVTDSLGCKNATSILLSQPAQLTSSVTANNITCAGGTDGNIDIAINGGVAPYTYQWSNGATTEDLMNIPVGSYTVVITDANQCSLQQVHVLSEPPPITIDYQVKEVSCSDQFDGVIYATPSGGTGAYTYSFSNGTNENPAIQLHGGEYTLVVVDNSGCQESVVVQVPVNPQECIDIPNCFTPNGDGKNDDWKIKNVYLYPNCTMQIFNRWGNLLFQSNGYPENWDGRYHGNKLPPETYYYILDLGNQKLPKTGSVTIVY